jgi:uncharacterized membrane protein
MFVFGIIFIVVFTVAVINIVRGMASGKTQGANMNGAGTKLQQAHDMHMQMHNQAHNMHMQMHQQAHDMHMQTHNTMFHM